MVFQGRTSTTGVNVSKRSQDRARTLRMLALAALLGSMILAPIQAAAAASADAATVSTVWPCVGLPAGGATVRLSGSGFWGPDGAAGGGDDVTSVLFAASFSDLTPGTALSISSASSLTVMSPTRPDGNVVSLAITFADSSYAFKQNAFKYTSDPSDLGPCGVAATAVPSFQTFQYSGSCPTISGTFEITGDRLDELDTADETWGVWIRQGGSPGVNTLLEPGPTEQRAELIDQTAQSLVFRLPDEAAMPGWTPGDIVDLIVRNGRGQVGYGGINWHRPGRCWQFDPDASNVPEGSWPACDTSTVIGCYVLTDTNGAPVPALAAWIIGHRTSDASNWGVNFHVVPADTLALLAPGQNPWQDWTAAEARPLDGLTGDGTFDLTGLLPANGTVRLTLRTGNLKPPTGAALRAVVASATGIVNGAGNGTNTITIDLAPAEVTFPAENDLPNCTLGVEPGTAIPFTRPECSLDQGGSTRTTISGELTRNSFWHPTNGQWMTTNAPLVGGYELVRGADGAPVLRIAVGAPHLTEGGQQNVGFVQAFITEWQLANLGLAPSSAADLAAALQITRDDQVGVLTADFQHLDGGFLVTIDGMHFSAPLISARTRPATLTTTADPAPCATEQLVVSGSGFAFADGASRVEEVTFRESEYEQVPAPSFHVLADGTLAASLPPTLGQGVVSIHAFGQFGEIGGLEYRHVAAPAAIPADRHVQLDWSASDWGPGDPITDYMVQQSTNCGTWSTLRDGKGTFTSYSVSRLANGSTYRFRVAPLRGATRGEWSAVVPATPRTVPNAPSGVQVASGTRSLVVTWAAPFDGGSPIIDYIVQYSVDRKTWTTFADGMSTSTSATITGLLPRVTYRVRIIASNAVGAGASSATASGTTSGP